MVGTLKGPVRGDRGARVVRLNNPEVRRKRAQVRHRSLHAISCRHIGLSVGTERSQCSRLFCNDLEREVCGRCVKLEGASAVDIVLKKVRAQPDSLIPIFEVINLRSQEH